MMKYGKLTFIRECGQSKDKHILWECLCDCGNVYVGYASKIRREKTTHCKKCGYKKTAEKNSTHGMKYSKEYSSWRAMKDRCLNKSSKDYSIYGAIGITVCDEWKDSFENFFRDMGKKPHGYSIDRINNNLGYSKENCRWASRNTQQKNKSNSFFVVINENIYDSLTDAANAYGVAKQTIYKWVYGWVDNRRNKTWSAKDGCRIISKY